MNNRTLAAEKRKTQAAPVQYWTTITGSIHRGPPTVGGLLKAVLFIRFQWRPTMRPCDECGGSGNAPAGRRGGQPVFKLCGRCVDMPWLPWHLLDNETQADVVRGRFKPDPDTIFWMCWQFGWGWPGDLYATRPKHHRGDPDGVPHNAHCGWVARPQRLEVIDE